jgi:PKD repeat protein
LIGTWQVPAKCCPHGCSKRTELNHRSYVALPLLLAVIVFMSSIVPGFSLATHLSIASLGPTDQPLQVWFDGTPELTTSYPTNYEFNVAAKTSTGLWITTLHWDFGDGSTLDVPFSAQSWINDVRYHAYSQPGNYTVSVTAYDNMGNSGSAQEQVTWPDPAGPWAAGQSLTVSNAVVQQADSLQLPSGGQLYLYGFVTGGAHSSTPFTKGQYASVTNAVGNLVASLAATTSNSNSFTTQTSYYSIGGASISGYSSYTESYATDSSPGSSAVSDHFTVPTADSLVVVFALGGDEQCLTVSGLPGFSIDATNINSAAQTNVITIGHAYLGANSYIVTEQTQQCAAGQTPSHAGNLIGVFVFQPSQGPCGNPTIALGTPSVNGLSVTVNANAQSGGSGCSITSVSWSWGDGSSSTGSTGTHTYSSASTYTITATAFQSDGKTTSVSTSVALGASSCSGSVSVTSLYSDCVSVVIYSGYLFGSTTEGGSVTYQSAATASERVDAPQASSSGTVLGGNVEILYVPLGESISLSASPQFGFNFDGWSVTNALSTGPNSATVNLSSPSVNVAANGNGCVVANFSPSPSFRIIPSCLPSAALHDPYSSTLSASGGTPPYVWSITFAAAELNAMGLTLSSTGVLSGTPENYGPVSFTAQVKDSSGLTATREFILPVTPGVQLECPVGPLGPSGPLGCSFTGKPNEFNSFSLQANGGVPPYTFFHASPCCFPSVLQLDSSSGVISGTLTEAGVYPFTIGVRDSEGAISTQELNVIIPPVVTGVTPQSGSQGGGGRVTITGIGFTGAKSVSFGTQTTQNFQLISDTELKATVPAASQACQALTSPTSPNPCLAIVAVTVGGVASGGYCLLDNLPGTLTCYQFVYLPPTVQLSCASSGPISFPTQTVSYSVNQFTSVTGSFGFTSSFKLCIAVQNNNIQELSSTATFTPSVTGTLAVQAGVSFGPVPIGASFQADPFVIPAGPVPIVVVPTFTPVLTVGAYAGPTVKMQITSSPSEAITLTYTPSSNSLGVQPSPPTCENGGNPSTMCTTMTFPIENPLSVSATAALGVDVTFEFYWLAGPSIIPQASLTLSAGINGGSACDGSTQTGNWWVVCAGINVGLGGTIAPAGWACPNCISAPLTWEGPQVRVSNGSLSASPLNTASNDWSQLASATEVKKAIVP